MKKLCFLPLLVAVICIIGCQKTPEDSIITQKNQSTMLSLSKGKNKLDFTDIPAHITNRLQTDDKRLSVSIDAEIHILGTKFPVIRVTPADFSQDQIQQLIDVFLGDAILYDLDYIYSKQEISSQIMLLQRCKEKYDSLDRSEEYNEKMKNLEEVFSDAPDSHEPKLSSRHLEDIIVEQGNTTYRYTGMDVGESNLPLQYSRYLYVRNNWYPTSIRGAELTYCDNRRGQISDLITISSVEATVDAQTRSDQSSQFKISPLDAKKIAEEFITELNLQFSVFDILLIKDGKINELGDIPTEPSEYSYEVRCTRKFKDSSSVLFSVPSQIKTDSYSASWAYEQLYVYIGSEGIYRIDWASPYEQQRTLVEESSMLDFDSINQIINAPLSYVKVLDDPNNNINTVNITITTIYLGMQRIIEENSIESGLLIPVWSVFGNITYNYSDGTSESINSKLSASPILVINAIDGTIIDPVRGY